MTAQDSERLYRSSPPPILPETSERSEKVGYKHGNGHGQGSEAGEENDGLGELPLPSMIKRSKSAAGGYRLGGGSGGKSCYADGVLMESHGRDQDHASGYTWVLPFFKIKEIQTDEM